MLIDSHCHLPDKKYGKSTEEVIKEAFAEDVVKLISIGTSVKYSKVACETAKQFENVFATVAIYPHEHRHEPFEGLINSLQELVDTYKKVVAVGECGVDISNWENARPLNDQLQLFELQIELATKNKLPVCVHNRNGDEHVLNLLQKYKNNNLRGVIHCFDSNWEFAKKVLDLGFYISFSGMVTYPSKHVLHEVVEKVPLERFLVETDAPYLPPQEYRGGVNYPKYVKIVATKVAQIKQKSFEEICDCSYKNTCDLFNI